MTTQQLRSLLAELQALKALADELPVTKEGMASFLAMKAQFEKHKLKFPWLADLPSVDPLRVAWEAARVGHAIPPDNSCQTEQT